MVVVLGLFLGLMLPYASPEGVDNDALGFAMDLRITISIGTNSVGCDLEEPPD